MLLLEELHGRATQPPRELFFMVLSRAAAARLGRTEGTRELRGSSMAAAPMYSLEIEANMNIVDVSTALGGKGEFGLATPNPAL